MTETFNPVMADINLSTPFRFARIIASLRSGDASFAHFGYLLTRGRILPIAAYRAYTLQALVRMVSAPTAGSLSVLQLGLSPAIEPITS